MKNQRASHLAILLVLLLAACAAKQTLVTVMPGDGEKSVQIEVSSFSFVPTIVQATRGDRLLLRVTNLADSAHNLSGRNPGGFAIPSASPTSCVSIWKPRIQACAWYTPTGRVAWWSGLAVGWGR